VFNARVDPEQGGNVWEPTVINGASWYLTDASTVDASKGGLVAANKATVRIPEGADAGGKAYADPITYANAEDVSGLWTLQAGDVIVKGEVTGASWTPARLKAAYADCVTVLGVTDNRRAPKAPHWKVTAT
jgi:hypothetical protein